MKDESFIGGLPTDKKSEGLGYDDFSDLKEGDLSDEGDIREALLKRYEAYGKQKADLLQMKLQELEAELSNTIANGEKVEILGDIEAAKTELTAVQTQFDEHNDGEEDIAPVISLPDYANLAATVIQPTKPPLWEEKFAAQIAAEQRARSAVHTNGGMEEMSEQVVAQPDESAEDNKGFEIQDDVIVLDRSQWRHVDGAKENQEPSEHWQLKRAMREAKSNYLAKLEEDVSQRGRLQKMFGFGRKNLTPAVQESYDAFMAANKAYYQFAKESSRYQKINSWLLERQEKSDTPTGVYGAVADRHVFKPARERLAAQERQMPAPVQKLLKTIMANPKLKWGLLGASVVATAGGSIFGMIAGKATKWGLEKTYVKGKEQAHQRDGEAIINTMVAKEDIDLDELEEYYFSSALAIDTAKVRTNMAGMAVGAATTAGAGYAVGSDFFSEATASGAETTDGMTGELNPEEPVVTTEAAPVVALEPVEQTAGLSDAAAEKLVTLEAGNTITDALYNGIKERIAAGQLTLPPGVTPDSISHYIYQSFPEMTNAADVAARLTPQEWMELGLSSGDPQQVMAGESINVQGLIDKLSNASVEVSKPVVDGAVPFEVGDQSIAAVDGGLKDSVMTPDQPAAVSEPSPESPVVPEKVATVVPPSPEVPPVTSPVAEVLPETPSADVPTGSPEDATSKLLATDKTIVSSKDSILTARMNPASAQLSEIMSGYQPQMSPELAKSAWSIPDGVDQSAFTKELYRQTLEAYRTGNISLPVEVAKNIQANPTAINAFVDRNAAEFAEFNPFISKTGLDLTNAQWKEIGFSSGDPEVISSGDTIQMGKLIKLILENAAEKINGKLPHSTI
jgi:hypothetical protein